MKTPALETREEIRSRMLQQAVRLWETDDVPVDPAGFDPLVNLLLGALATESERTYREIQASRGRMLERLIELLLPDVLTAPTPAHSVMAAQGLESVDAVRPADTFTVTPIQPGQPLPVSSVAVTPAGTFAVANGRVAAMAAGGDLWRIDGQEALLQNRSPLAQAPFLRRLPDHAVWIGLDMPLTQPTTRSLRFFFDWDNTDARSANVAETLPYTTWWHTDVPLTVESGLDTQPETDAPGDARRLEQDVCAYYQAQFLRVTGTFAPPQPSAQGTFCPSALEAVFDPAQLQALPPLVWLRIDFPGRMDPKIASRMVCVLNAFPVLNRQLLRATHRLSEGLSIAPIDAEWPLLDVVDVSDSEGNTYLPYADSKALAPGQPAYAIRRLGVGRFSEQSATSLIQQFFDLIQDEVAAFSALGPDQFRSNLDDIDRSLLRIRQALPPPTTREETPYLVVQNAPATGLLFIDYWATAADKANRIPAGSRVENPSPMFVRESLRLLRPLLGGKARLTAADSLPQFRRALLSRGRVLTPEDIRAVCRWVAPEVIDRVEVTKGVYISPDPKKGLQRTVDVVLIPRTPDQLAPEAARHISSTISATLTQQWTGLLPLRVLWQPNPSP